MTCDECNILLGSFMDHELDEGQALAVREHLALCDACARVCEELAAILGECNAASADEIVPPNSRALWCRINNIIESDLGAPPPSGPQPKAIFWRLSVLQLTAAMLFIAVVSSLLTIVAIRNYTRPPAEPSQANSGASSSVFDKVLGRLGLVETPQQARERRLRQQQAAIDYWNQRVQARRVQWDRTTREAFDRNLQVIDESVNEYTLILQQNPDDDLSGEMLDSVLSEKMNLLRDFSDL